MKGVSIAITALVVLILAAVVLLSYIYLIKPPVDQVDIFQYQSELRSCCADRTKYDCAVSSGVTCKVTWSDTPIPLTDLAEKAGFTDISSQEFQSFCFCT